MESISEWHKGVMERGHCAAENEGLYCCIESLNVLKLDQLLIAVQQWYEVGDNSTPNLREAWEAFQEDAE